jgi:hypothetical protein
MSRLRVTPDDGAAGDVREAEALLQIGTELAAGYVGFYHRTGAAR